MKVQYLFFRNRSFYTSKEQYSFGFSAESVQATPLRGDVIMHVAQKQNQRDKGKWEREGGVVNVQ